MTFPHLEVK